MAKELTLDITDLNLPTAATQEYADLVAAIINQEPTLLSLKFAGKTMTLAPEATLNAAIDVINAHTRGQDPIMDKFVDALEATLN